MKNVKKVVSLILIILLILQMNLGTVFAAITDVQKPPEHLSIDGIGYDQFDKNFVDLLFDFPAGFFVSGTTGTYLNFYSQEVMKAYKAGGGVRTLKEGNIPADANNRTYRMKNLNSGTIYYADMTAYYKYLNGNASANGQESAASNRVKFMTDIDTAAFTIGTNQLKIEWDDVWNTSGRISYRLYISDSSDFKNTAPRYIDEADIGPGKPVQVDQTRGKLVYTHTVKEAGRVYYVKIVPVITDDELQDYSRESKTVLVSSFILVKTTKVSSTTDGAIWRLDWSPVIVGLSDSDIDIEYEVYKGKINSNELPGRIQTLKNTSMYVVLAPGEDLVNYYIIRALVTRNGQDVYPGIKIESDKIMVKDQEVGSNPPTPQLVNQLGNVIGGDAGVKPDNAAFLWKIPKKVSGGIDYATSYDVWITSDPNLLSDPDKLGDPVSWNMSDGANTIASGSLSFNFDFVRDGTNTLGCKLLVSGLNQNTTYYFRIQARKSYLAYVDDVLKLVPFSSEPALQTIITPVDGSINQPVAPPRPPFRIKEHPAGTRVISDKTVTLQIKNRWYEQHSTITNKWSYIETENYIEGTTQKPFNYPIQGPDINDFRMQQYDSQVKINVYYAKYEEGKDYTDPDIVAKYTPTVVRDFSTAANDPYEEVAFNYPDFEFKRNADMLVTGLEPNTTYVVWVKAFRGDSASEPSDPIIVTTDPSDTNPVEKPPVPVFNYNQPADVYIDLGWNYNGKYKYYIKYGTSENMNSAKGTLTVDMQGLNYYRIPGLDKDTIYYFWIQAEYTNSLGESAKSDWSDPYSVKTLPDIPPETPLGFGIKTASDAVTKNSITYEWLPMAGMQFILEIASNPSFTDSKTYEAGTANEFKVDGLKSNFRYYARLYAYNPANKLRSKPTASVSAKTLRSGDDYDSGQDNETVISGDYIVKDANAIKGVWHIRITGINADRFVEHIQTDHVLDYTLDLSAPPAKVTQISVLISAKVFNALGKLKENLIIDTDGSRFVIRPGVLSMNTGSKSANVSNTDFELLITSPGQSPSASRNMSFKTGIIGVDIIKHSGGNDIDVEKLGKPLQIYIPYNDKSWYSLGKTLPVASTDDGVWNSLKTTSATYDPDTAIGSLGFETLYPGSFAVADKGNDYFDDIYDNAYEASISNVAQTHELKSVKGNYFKPGAYIVTGDAVKLMFDSLEYKYGSNYMSVAVKSGIIKYEETKNANALSKRETVIAMVVRVYELKSGESAVLTSESLNSYIDINRANPILIPKIRYAYENGMLPDGWKTLKPKNNITRGETMYILEKALVLAGDMD